MPVVPPKEKPCVDPVADPAGLLPPAPPNENPPVPPPDVPPPKVNDIALKHKQRAFFVVSTENPSQYFGYITCKKLVEVVQMSLEKKLKMETGKWFMSILYFAHTKKQDVFTVGDFYHEI